MADLIDRQKAMDALNHELRCGAVINQCGLEAAYEVIEDLPTAEPQIIRCRECEKERWCKFTQYQGENGYCSLAERRENG